MTCASCSIISWANRPHTEARGNAVSRPRGDAQRSPGPRVSPSVSSPLPGQSGMVGPCPPCTFFPFCWGSSRIRSFLTEAAGSKGRAQGRGAQAASAEPQAAPHHSPSRRTCPRFAGWSVRPRVGGLSDTPASQRQGWAVGPPEPEGTSQLGSGASAHGREAVERPQTPEASCGSRCPRAPRPLQGKVPTSEGRDERLSFQAQSGPQA